MKKPAHNEFLHFYSHSPLEAPEQLQTKGPFDAAATETDMSHEVEAYKGHHLPTSLSL
jgi:hypothetical protein